MFTHAVGGLHEVYFPYVLSDLWLLLPLIAGGMAGNIMFQLLGAGLAGAVSPGSLITIFIMAGKSGILPVLAGIVVSGMASFAGGVLVLKRTGGWCPEGVQTEKGCMTMPEKEEKYGNIKKIAVICDGGVGTSAMGAALLRRQLTRERVTDVQAEAWAADLVPDDADLLVCQKDYGSHLPKALKGRKIYMIDSLLSADAYGNLVREIQQDRR
jgi:PTS system mannitol-specific IIC component